MNSSTIVSNIASSAIGGTPFGIIESLFPFSGLVSRYIATSLGLDVAYVLTAGALAFSLYRLISYLWSVAEPLYVEWFMSSVKVMGDTRTYEEIMLWVRAYVLNEDARFLQIFNKQRYRNFIEYSGSDDFDFIGIYQGSLLEGMDRDTTPYYPKVDRVGFWNARRYFALRIHEPRNPRDADDSHLELSTYGRSSAPLKKFIRMCQDYHTEQQKRITSVDYGRTKTARLSRPLDTVVLDAATKNMIMDDLHSFIAKETRFFYAEQGIPHRRSYLFWGPPGTGKSSFALALAGHLGFSLSAINLGDADVTDFQIMDRMTTTDPKSVVLLEDIDAVNLERDLARGVKPAEGQGQGPGQGAVAKTDLDEQYVARREDAGERVTPSPDSNTLHVPRITLSGILNALDGVASADGRIVIMTSNDPKSLDPALTRPGRVDVTAYFGRLSKMQTSQMFARMFSRKLNAQRVDAVSNDSDSSSECVDGENIDALDATRESRIAAYGMQQIESMAEAFADTVPHNKVTPAELQGYLLKSRKDPRKALDGVGDWLDGLFNKERFSEKEAEEQKRINEKQEGLLQVKKEPP